MLPFEMIAGGTFTPTLNVPFDIQLISQNPPDFFFARNLTGWGELNDAQAIEWWWQRSLGNGVARGIVQTSDGANPAMIARTIAADGISVYDTANPPTFAALAGTAITNANPAVVSMANTGTIAVGDIVRVMNVTNMQQISGMDFQVRAVTANVSITLMLDASSFAAPGTTCSIRKFIPGRFYPRYRWINSISQAAQAVVTFTVNNDFTPGEIVTFRVPSQFGMDEINNRPARVLSVTNSSTASSITIDLDTTGFTAFAFPTSAVAVTSRIEQATCLPSSSGVVPNPLNTALVQQPPGTNLLDAFDNRNTRVIHMGASLFTDFTQGDVWMWQAFKGSQYNGN